MSMAATTLSPGFADPVGDAQGTFRAVLTALSRPGQIVELAALPPAPAPLMPATVALLLALADYDTGVWLDGAADTPAVVEHLRFHCGSPLTAQCNVADFAVIAEPAGMPALARFKPGTDEYPDRSATLIVQVDTLASDRGWTLRGPGIETAAALDVAPLPSDFRDQLAANHARYPCGVDLLFVAGSRLAALPRSIRVEG